jgi:GNAT superfamily N-acetyltransferase
VTSIRLMTPADLLMGLRLGHQAGWNQTDADWRRFLDLQPDGCFVAEWDGVPAGTTTTSIFGPVAWIAMVLVDEVLRGRGIATALLDRALEFLDRRGVPSIRLDATPLGRPLYERLGFAEQFRLARYEGTLPATLAPDAQSVAVVAAEEWPALAALDEGVTAADRRRLLLRLFAEHPDSVRVVRHGDRLDGFLAARPGRRAVQLGPCIASREAGALLFADGWRRYAGQRVYLDVPVANAAATRMAAAQGLTVQRHLTRMCRGTPSCERGEWLWASAGPEKG